MVQKYQSPVRIYKHPFELVMAAYEKRFPTCKMIPVFVGSDITYEYKSDDGAEHIIERKCKLNVECPYLLKKIVGVDYVYFIQRNSLDRRNRTLKIEARNDSFSSRIVINENCTYSVHPENSEWTCFEQSASLDVKSFFGFESTVEKIAMKQYSLNIGKGKEVIEYYINELLSEGVTYIEPFCDEPIEENPNENGETEEGKADEQKKPLPPQITISPADAQTQRVRTKSISQDNSACSSEADFKLDADYIERCLGTLNPLQESRLVQLRKWVSEAHKGKIPSDSTMLRFLRAREFNVEKAREMLCQSLVWRKKYQVDRLLNTYEMPQVAKDFFPGGWHHYDKDGRPLYILKVGQMDVKGHLRSIGEEGMLKLTMHICEEGLKRTEEQTLRIGRPIGTWSCLLDLEGLNMRHLWRPGIKALLRIIEIVEANYPETLGRVLVVRAPRMFPILWTIVSTFIDEKTRQKFLLFGINDINSTDSGLLNYVDEEFLPEFLGGKCAMEGMSEGGLIPKALYLPDEEYERVFSEDNPLNLNSIYNVISLNRGQVHEVILSGQDKGCVICWDFDILKQDVDFIVLYTAKPVTPISQSPPSTPLGPLMHEWNSCLDKSWVEGVDYMKVEPLIVCHDGESIQGSHVTSREGGTYILQWRYHEAIGHHGHHHHGHHHFDIIESITTPKAKVMYYYEVLKSHDYKGSMSSLQSFQSSVSALSTASTRSVISSCPSR